jgi:hypothetical protein
VPVQLEKVLTEAGADAPALAPVLRPPPDQMPCAVHPIVTSDTSGMSPIVGTLHPHIDIADYSVCEAKLDEPESSLYVKVEQARDAHDGGLLEEPLFVCRGAASLRNSDTNLPVMIEQPRARRCDSELDWAVLGELPWDLPEANGASVTR